jgi:hypothetical protein
MKRKDFQELAAVRLKEARVLLRAGCYEGAYYLAGYAVECALKACISKQTERHEFPDRDPGAEDPHAQTGGSGGAGRARRESKRSGADQPGTERELEHCERLAGAEPIRASLAA